MTNIDVGSTYLFTRTDVAKGVYRKAVYARIVAVVNVGRAGMIESRGL
jgi:hypothetical protein